jgi:hypothetical protein
MDEWWKLGTSSDRSDLSSIVGLISGVMRPQIGERASHGRLG